MEWVTEWDQPSFLRRKAEDFIDILDFIFTCIRLYWGYILAVGFAWFFFYVYISGFEYGIWQIHFNAGDPIYLLIGLMVMMVFAAGFSQRRCCA